MTTQTHHCDENVPYVLDCYCLKTSYISYKLPLSASHILRDKYSHKMSYETPSDLLSVFGCITVTIISYGKNVLGETR